MQDVGSDGESGVDSERTDVEVEYVPDQVDKDLAYFQFTRIFEKFRFDDKVEEKVEPKEEVPTDPAVQK